jgi:hypothetical protein
MTFLIALLLRTIHSAMRMLQGRHFSERSVTSTTQSRLHKAAGVQEVLACARTTAAHSAAAARVTSLLGAVGSYFTLAAFALDRIQFESESATRERIPFRNFIMRLLGIIGC